MSHTQRQHHRQKADFWPLAQALINKKPDIEFTRIFYHLKTVWLFNVNDLKTIVFPSTFFAFCTGLSILVKRDELDSSEASLYLLTRLPHVFAWLWTTLLAFTINNQRSPDSVTEDALNKPWRPIPAERLTAYQAKRLGLFAYFTSFFVACCLGRAVVPTLCLFFQFVLHNELHGGDKSLVFRNLLNAGGFITFAAGAYEVAMQVPIHKNLASWLCMIAGIVGTTIHTQDMYDQVGDRAAGRRTIPLIIGDVPARWSIAALVIFWSIQAPQFWEAKTYGHLFCFTMGSLVAKRSLTKTKVSEDRTTFKLWNLWLMVVYMLPLCC